MWEEPTHPRLPFLTMHTTSLLPSTSSVVYHSTLHPENIPQWELQWSSWLHWWLRSGSTDHIHSNLSCSTAHFQTAEGISCRMVLRVRRFRMQWFQIPTKNVPFLLCLRAALMFHRRPGYKLHGYKTYSSVSGRQSQDSLFWRWSGLVFMSMQREHFHLSSRI